MFRSQSNTLGRMMLIVPGTMAIVFIGNFRNSLFQILHSTSDHESRVFPTFPGLSNNKDSREIILLFSSTYFFVMFFGPTNREKSTNMAT